MGRRSELFGLIRIPVLKEVVSGTEKEAKKGVGVEFDTIRKETGNAIEIMTKKVRIVRRAVKNDVLGHGY